MANEEKKNKCARATCGCPAADDSKYCCEECAAADHAHIMEIACTCHHPECDLAV